MSAIEEAYSGWSWDAEKNLSRAAEAERHLGRILSAVRLRDVAKAIEEARARYGKTLPAGRKGGRR